MVTSASDQFLPNNKVVFHVFTDQEQKIEEFRIRNPKIQVIIHPIPSYGWPEATLLRYRIYEEHFAKLTEDILMHLDADMLITASAEHIFEKLDFLDGLHFVSHPGYWRPKGLPRTMFYLVNPTFMLRDLKLFLEYGGLGTWEKRRKSTAYVPRRKRDKYACGGIWFGSNEPFKSFVRNMSRNVDQDLQNGVIAKWHDESHLNRWVSEGSYILVTPSLCHDATFPNLKGLQSIVVAVKK
jgi:histo-blood group ABO system transferase